MSRPLFDQTFRQESTQLPASLLAPEFGKIYVRDEGAVRNVEFTIKLPELEGAAAEGWQTGVALDASASMKTWYGRNLTGSLPPELADRYRYKGWVVDAVHDGKKVTTFKKEAYEDAIKQGVLRYTENIVESLAREFISYLAGQLDADGGTTVLYWACGHDGSLYEVLGDFTAEKCKTLELKGPEKVPFGNGTRLVPAVRYFVDRFKTAARGLYVFITDGRVDDLGSLKIFTTGIAKEIAAKKRNPVKCVLIGVGNEIDKDQMGELDDLDTGTNVDVWDAKVAADMRGVNEIIVELVDARTIVAPTATIYDATGKVVATFADGLPARAAFQMPNTSAFFELEVAGRRIRQTAVTQRSSG